MLVILDDLGVVRGATHSPLQIEELIDLPDILPDLYGTRKGRTITRSDVDAYLSEVQRIKAKFAKALRDRG
jgi:hypothetical protein